MTGSASTATVARSGSKTVTPVGPPMDSSWSGLVPSSEERHHKRQVYSRGVANGSTDGPPQTARVGVVTESPPSPLIRTWPMRGAVCPLTATAYLSVPPTLHASSGRWSGVWLRCDGGCRTSGPAVDAESCVDVRQVPLDGPYRQVETLGDLVVAASLCHEVDDLTLAIGQGHLVGGRPAIGAEELRDLRDES